AHSNEAMMRNLLKKLTAVISQYLIAQFQAGAHVVQLFDSWGGMLDESQYRLWSLPYVEQIVRELHAVGCPVIFYVGNSAHLLPALETTCANAISLDWRVPLARAEDVLGANKTIQGNLSPAALFGTTADVDGRARSMLSKLKRRNRFIANLGHGVLQTTLPENVAAFVAAIRKGWSDS
ncbi:MAG: hypothetical protein KDD44_13780, partial [Bdellovibrionales bacterium]|nr:hypothetical protein [Bdellovibrionales bacterium]